MGDTTASGMDAPWTEGTRVALGEMAPDLSQFSNAGFDRGAGSVKELAWLLLRRPLFDRSVLPWYWLRRRALRLFGAEVAGGVVIKGGVRVTFPWRLAVGEDSWRRRIC
jgi:putative colanic acid biosynthesis acetyltransferase WcaF